MKIRWTEPAANDFEHLVLHIGGEHPVAARRIAKRIYEGCSDLTKRPYLGRRGKMEGTRELVFAPLPYIAVYRIHESMIEILRIWHAAQDR